MIPKWSQWHEDPRLLARARGLPGRMLLWLVATLLLYWHGVGPLMPLALAAVMLHPAGRRLWLSLAAAGMLAARFLGQTGNPLSDVLPGPWLPAVATVAVGAAMLYLAYLATRQMDRWPAAAQRHPVLAVHVGIWLALALSGLPWLGVLGMVPFFAWRLSYLAAAGSRGNLAGTRFRDHLFYLVPVYGGTTTPYGKGLDFLSRHEAADQASFTRSQLAGLKLLLLAGLWLYAADLLDTFVFGQATQRLPAGFADWTLGWPRLEVAVQSGAPLSRPLGWAIVYLELFHATLRLAAFGHVIVGCLRLLGFNVFRNTYKPLLSESIVEFWNRYYYYFKELLVDFFFYPTYLRLRRLGPRTRMFAAVFAAAFAGNMYHHLLTSPEFIVHFDAHRLWDTWSPRLVYCSLLALGIWLSMLRQQKLRAAGGNARPALRVCRIAGVLTFYALIQIWNIRREGVSAADCMRFFGSLFGF